MRIVISANGNLNPGPVIDRVLAQAAGGLFVAADGGARHFTTLGIEPDIVVGDMDSLSADELARCEAAGAEILRHSPEKDETDLELALLLAAQRGADWIRVIGALGGRLDQTFANVLLLTLPALAGRDVRLASGSQLAWLLRPGTHALQGNPGDTLSLIPLDGSIEDMTSDGLAFQLSHETLDFGPARGVSNRFDRPTASLSFGRGTLLVVHSLGRA